jgi:nucleoside-diphosphate-sugar epimerase
MKILITGASGIIGSALIKKLRSKDNLIICQSRESHPDRPMLKWIKHDLITNSWNKLDGYEIDIVYHLAGQTSTYEAKKSPIGDLESNVVSLLQLLEYFRGQLKRPFVVIAGTATEVGLTKILPINEDMQEKPVTYYDLSKLTAEMYLKQYVREGLAKGCALRLSNVFGNSNRGQQRDRGILDKIFSRAACGQNINIYGNGNYLRDYIFIDDVVSAFIAASTHQQQTNGRSFYIGSGKGIAMKDAFLKVASLAAKMTGTEVKYELIAPPAELSKIEYRNAVIDSSAFTEATGWLPQYDFDEGIRKAYSEKKSDSQILSISHKTDRASGTPCFNSTL